MLQWDEFNTSHVQRHGIEPADAEEAVTDPRRLGVPASNTGSEERRPVLGATAAGRLLVVVMTRRAGLIRIVTARDATQGEKKHYRTRGK
ncbi:MAG TPA: BrnT family toxin [Chloroflexota bacterium]|nr:BrnT family toxin [Chloroflexota bacterium]